MYKLSFIIILCLCADSYAQKSDFRHINFKKSDSIAKSCDIKNLYNLPLLVHKLTSQLDTDVEKFRAIHTWVCLNIESDHYFGDKTLRKRKKFKNDSLAFSIWNNQERSKMFKRLLKNQKTICSGYAYLIKELSNFAGIDCKVIDGYSRTTERNVGKIDIPNHSWNAVLLNKKWYLVDATLASGFFFVNENKFIKRYNDGYFLADPDLFIKSHFPLEEKWILVKDTPTLQQFVSGPLVYGKTFENKVIPIEPKILVNKEYQDESITFKYRFKDELDIENIDFVVSYGNSFKSILPEGLVYEDGILEFTYQLSKKGRFDVHLKIDDDIVVSYNLEVKKRRNTMTISFN